ncbi:hypothetical protein BABINDRAFT_160371 [Babjeviella inositovora NRRL Y-12698]|uniref:Uncharacterized protein n=1 Tax=Babjeviella inositovora NRRL Y-12698 TaxID=984486 RepID=A0A1E3QTA6_9ASCO|nr:uncharacterized protein BABINDRAFT_160371 [Babjeviella inositovora NRRL Y-12698]ODQ80935.1 hypothetical protein BABINDRAFT_160371 [Babjeviella inositovora NRRL Y-12698]
MLAVNNYQYIHDTVKGSHNAAGSNGHAENLALESDLVRERLKAGHHSGDETGKLQYDT